MLTVRELVVMSDDTGGPIIRWHDYGYEGWQPTSFKTIRDALVGFEAGDVLTRHVEFKVIEITEGQGTV
jgi:hypothetical protein